MYTKIHEVYKNELAVSQVALHKCALNSKEPRTYENLALPMEANLISLNTTAIQEEFEQHKRQFFSYKNIYYVQNLAYIISTLALAVCTIILLITTCVFGCKLKKQKKSRQSTTQARQSGESLFYCFNNSTRRRPVRQF